MTNGDRNCQTEHNGCKCIMLPAGIAVYGEAHSAVKLHLCAQAFELLVCRIVMNATQD